MRGPDRPYTRAVVLASPQVEVMVARWAEGASCAPHDHGGAHGRVFFLEGNFLERRYLRGPEGWLETSARRWPEGSVSEIDPALTHACSSERGALSLHVYFPRIRGMKVHSLATRQTFVVTESSGAWVPTSPTDYLSVESW